MAIRPLGMAESAMEFVRICHDAGFYNMVLSMKSSNVRVMVEATRLLVHKMITENMMFPVHLGVTEAGNELEGRMKSAAGIGSLLADGIGDTIRVSLTEPPENEIPVAKQIVSFFPKPNSINPEITESLTLSQIADYEYQRRISSPVGNIGNGKFPVVLRELSGIHTIDEHGHVEGNHGNRFEHGEPAPGSNQLKYLFADPMQEDFGWQSFRQYPGNDFLLVLKLTSSTSVFRVRAIIHEMDSVGLKAPVVLAYDDANPDLRGFAIDAALRLSPLLNDGLCDGIFLNNSALDPEKVNSVAFGVLQASRARITQTEYIACPGCGRTQYKLEEAFEKVKAATSHLKGLKIAVMGCIVNGPGEMADADYGYVGQGSGKVSIYKGKTPLKKNIAEENAVEALISVIAAHGQWVSP
jgi:(E)-4-hydroxy-3-methylbut-2-enyl-diphosphate synthase